MAFGILYLIAAFLFLRRLSGISELEALIITAFCGLHPRVVFYSGCLLTEIPFAALTLWAIVLAQKAAQRKEGTASVATCGILTGLAMVLRVLGVPVAAGIAVDLALRRSWRQLVVFCGSVAPFFGALIWRVIFSHAVSPVSGAAALSPGWIHTWAYYSSYADVWRQGVPNASIFAAMLGHNALWLFRAPAEYFVSPLPAESTLGPAVLIALLTLLIMKGIVSFSPDFGFRPVYWVLLFYGFAVLLWNYPYAIRFLIPFLPLFAAGLWIEGRHVLKMAHAALTGPRPPGEKLVAAALGIFVVVFIFAVSLNYVGGMRKRFAERSRERRALLPEKREAYDWLIRSTDTNARIVAFEDACLYLYSGRVAVRPVTFPIAASYERRRLDSVLEHITDVAQAVAADYWVVSDDDYIFEGRDGYLGYEARMKELEGVLPLVYSSERGHVRIYSLGCIQHAEDSSCKSARRVLFPSAGEKALSGSFSRGSKSWN
jgi:hypothetical protein